MAGRNTVKLPSADDVYRLTRKLDEQSDISLKEADWIYSLFSIKTLRTKLNPHSTGADSELMKALGDWFDAVAKKIEQGYRGNFLFSIAFSVHMLGALQYTISLAHDALNQYGCLEDFFTTLTVSAELYNSLPKWLQQLFTKANEGVPDKMHLIHKNFYVLKSPRAGMYYYPIKTATGTYTIAQFVKKLSPAIITGIPFRIERELFKVHKLLKTMFSMTSGSLPTPEAWSNEDIKLFILGSFIKFHNFPCIATCDYDCAIIFVEEKYAPIINAATKISFKELVENAIYNNVIDKTMVWILTTSRALENPLVKKFTEASIEYINEKIRMGMAQNFMKDMVENTSEWMDITR